MVEMVRRVNVTTLFLLFLCCSLILIIIYELAGIETLVQPLDAAIPPMSYQPTMLSAEYTSSPSEAFSEIYERPLFSRTRRPFMPSVKSTQNKSFDSELVGVLKTNKRQLVLLRSIQSDDAFGAYHTLTRAHPGQVVSGWLLEKIEKNRAIMRKGELRRILQLPRISHEE